ncbi:hypothetical protein [Piscirickettsia salmonis]|uniref:hypothetical protein n=1 Tax=Piscirickettsia salmonis TaxID=1238 RepID=UPI001E5BCC0C|nr:hypothetical protein [Piscirickettsia salmonis]
MSKIKVKVTVSNLLAKIVAIKPAGKEYSWLRLALADKSIDLFGKCLTCHIHNQGDTLEGVVLKCAADRLRVDVLFNASSEFFEDKVFEDKKNKENYIFTIKNSDCNGELLDKFYKVNGSSRLDSRYHLILVPKASLLMGLALALAYSDQDQQVLAKTLFLFESDQLPLAIRPSLRVIMGLPNYVIGNFQVLEDCGIAARIACINEEIGCYEGNLLSIFNDYVSYYLKHYSADSLMITLLPGASAPLQERLAILNVKSINKMS